MKVHHYLYIQVQNYFVLWVPTAYLLSQFMMRLSPFFWFLILNWTSLQKKTNFILLLFLGLFFGASFSYFLNGFIEYLLGWKYIFYVTGVITTLWSGLWYFIVFDSPKDHPSISESELSLIKASIGNHVTDKKVLIYFQWIL